MHMKQLKPLVINSALALALLFSTFQTVLASVEQHNGHRSGVGAVPRPAAKTDSTLQASPVYSEMIVDLEAESGDEVRFKHDNGDGAQERCEILWRNV